MQEKSTGEKKKNWQIPSLAMVSKDNASNDPLLHTRTLQEHPDCTVALGSQSVIKKILERKQDRVGIPNV